MFLFQINEETGENEIYCTECHRFIDNVCVRHCPVYDDEEVPTMTNKEKFKKVFGFDLPEALEHGCFHGGEGCPDINRRCIDCEFDGIYYWPKEYKLPEEERERILKRTNLDALRDAHEKIGPFDWVDIIAVGLCSTMICRDCPVKEKCEENHGALKPFQMLSAWLREEAPHE